MTGQQLALIYSAVLRAPPELRVWFLSRILQKLPPEPSMREIADALEAFGCDCNMFQLQPAIEDD